MATWNLCLLMTNTRSMLQRKRRTIDKHSLPFCLMHNSIAPHDPPSTLNVENEGAYLLNERATNSLTRRTQVQDAAVLPLESGDDDISPADDSQQSSKLRGSSQQPHAWTQLCCGLTLGFMLLLLALHERCSAPGVECTSIGPLQLPFVHALAQAAGLRSSGMHIVTPPVRKSPYDRRAFRALRLQNGMQALLISDPMASKAGAAMSVASGTFMEIGVGAGERGLAHFCEHMLFLGTKQFPVEDDYFHWVSAHGGGANAYTAMEETNFYFDVDTRFLLPTLHRFGDFFVAPLLSASGVSKEMHAVDSEFRKDLLSDGWREYQLLKQTANPRHPWHRFSIGNMNTLNTSTIRRDLLTYFNTHYGASRMRLVVSGREPLDILQREVGRVFGRVPRRWQEHHTRERSVLEDNTTRAALIAGARPDLLPYPRRLRGTRLWYAPVKDKSSVSLSWPLPPLARIYRARTGEFLSTILGNEQRGSALWLLKKRGWANSLVAGYSSRFVQFDIFDITVKLTNKGLSHVDDVIAVIFSYISITRLAAGVNDNQHIIEMRKRERLSLKILWNEFIAVRRLAFHFPAMPQQVGGYLSALASNLRVVGAGPDALNPPAIAKFDAKLVKLMMSIMTPKDVIIIGASPQYNRTSAHAAQVVRRSEADAPALSPVLDRVEPWFGTRFHQAPIEETLLNRWSSPALSDLKLLSLPPRNPFVPKSIALLQPVRSVGLGEAPPLPRLIVPSAETIAVASSAPDHSPQGNLVWWLRGAARFKQPRTDFRCLLVTPHAYSSARAMAMTELWLHALVDALDAPLYAAREVGYQLSIAFEPRSPDAGITFEFSGYSDRMIVFVTRAADEMRSALGAGDKHVGDTTNVDSGSDASGSNWLTARRYSRIYQEVNEKFRNFMREQPYNDALYFHRLWTQRPHWSIEAVLAELLTLEQGQGAAAVVAHGRSLLQSRSSALRCLAHGNLQRSDATRLARAFERGVWGTMGGKHKKHPIRTWGTHRALRLPAGSALVARYRALNPLENNGAVLVSFQLAAAATDYYATALLHMLQVLASQPAFKQLRTREQLGYIVWLFAQQSLGSLWLKIIVQGGEHNPDYVQERILAFMKGFRSQLAAMTEPQFKAQRDVEVAKLLRPPESLAAATNSLWSAVLRGSRPAAVVFDRKRRQAEALRRITLREMQLFYEQLLKPQTAEFRMLVIQVWGKMMRMPVGLSGTPTHETNGTYVLPATASNRSSLKRKWQVFV